ncbi:hypothetical protein [Pseudomonas plecoglossicida]|uniref:hypothetical protein n=1 Tax=Pseudomonas plecoglossicida TaxID=70775 RepID=UPI00051DE2EC|nr:hypothetical protein [Pseudomonas plecoglossicida]KGK24271.1 hypothetical protein GT93_05185 [Pseudomonas plecoglossicida]
MITADYGTLMRQAGMTATDYMIDAVDAIDRQFGEGYAKKHPELVGAFIQTAAADFNAACLSVAIQEFAASLSSKLYDIVGEMKEYRP